MQQNIHIVASDVLHTLLLFIIPRIGRKYEFQN